MLSGNEYYNSSFIIDHEFSGNRTGASCPVCGESFETDQHLLRHIRYLQWEEKQAETKKSEKTTDSSEKDESKNHTKTIR